MEYIDSNSKKISINNSDYKDMELISKQSSTSNQALLVFNNQIEIGELIGEGGFGEVFQGTYLTLYIAIKTPKNTVNNLIKEIKLLRLLRHPNVPQFYGISIEKTKRKTITSLIIERVFGVDMHQLFNNMSKYTDLVKIKFFIDLSNTLAYVHYNNIIHRDFKPSNIMVDHNFRVKLLDFGISKEAQDTMTTEHPRLGTYLYFSPEHCAIQNNIDDLKVAISKKTDVWALGLIINQLFSGEMPWANKGISNNNTFKVLVLLHNKEKFEISSKIKSKDIKEVIQKCTEYEKINRYNSEQVYLHLIYTLYMEIKEKGIKNLISEIKFSVNSETNSPKTSKTTLLILYLFIEYLFLCDLYKNLAILKTVLKESVFNQKKVKKKSSEDVNINSLSDREENLNSFDSFVNSTNTKTPPLKKLSSNDFKVNLNLYDTAYIDKKEFKISNFTMTSENPSSLILISPDGAIRSTSICGQKEEKAFTNLDIFSKDTEPVNLKFTILNHVLGRFLIFFLKSSKMIFFPILNNSCDSRAVDLNIDNFYGKDSKLNMNGYININSMDSINSIQNNFSVFNIKEDFYYIKDRPYNIQSFVLKKFLQYENDAILVFYQDFDKKIDHFMIVSCIETRIIAKYKIMHKSQSNINIMQYYYDSSFTVLFIIYTLNSSPNVLNLGVLEKDELSLIGSKKLDNKITLIECSGQNKFFVCCEPQQVVNSTSIVQYISLYKINIFDSTKEQFEIIWDNIIKEETIIKLRYILISNNFSLKSTNTNSINNQSSKDVNDNISLNGLLIVFTKSHIRIDLVRGTKFWHIRKVFLKQSPGRELISVKVFKLDHKLVKIDCKCRASRSNPNKVTKCKNCLQKYSNQISKDHHIKKTEKGNLHYGENRSYIEGKYIKTENADENTKFVIAFMYEEKDVYAYNFYKGKT